jgi:hypothetical protein
MGFGSLLRKARNIGPSVNLPGIGNISAADVLSGGMTKQADAALPHAQDMFRDTPVVGKALDADSSADIAAGQQQDALGKAQAYQERMYGEATGHLDPYYQMGQNAMLGTMGEDGTRTGGLVSDINSGKYLQDEFSYGGQQPDEFNYRGQQPEAFNYGGTGQQGQLNYRDQQKGQLDYSGGPVDRSIESYMKDDPSLAWQQEQMEKMRNRQGAAKGRWGGGATFREMNRDTAGLLSQDYANRFERGRLERQADVDTETAGYDRSKYGTELYNLAEQSNFDRAGSSLDRRNLAEQEGYNRYSDAQDYAIDRDQTGYDRASDMYDYNTAREQNAYNRTAGEYGLRNERLQNALNQKTALARFGPEMATAMSNAALGQGSTMADFAIQQGNVGASATMAGGNQFGKLLDMAGGAAKLYGAT